jgi:hypothetical protein
MLFLNLWKIKYKHKKFNLCFYNKLKYHYKFIFWFFAFIAAKNYLLANYYYHDQYALFLYKRVILTLFNKICFFKIPSYFNFFKKYYRLKNIFDKQIKPFDNNFLLVNYYLFKLFYLFFSKLNLLYKSNNYLFVVSNNIFIKDFFIKLFDFDLIFKFFDISYFKFFSFRKIMSFSFIFNFVNNFKYNFFLIKFLRLFIFIFQNFVKLLYFNLEIKKL